MIAILKSKVLSLLLCSSKGNGAVVVIILNYDNCIFNSVGLSTMIASAANLLPQSRTYGHTGIM
jgi:hypothetical protein